MAYQPPDAVQASTLGDLLSGTGRSLRDRRAPGLPLCPPPAAATPVWYAGDPGLLRGRCVAVVGSRDVSGEGARRAEALGRALAEAGVVVVSGLARGVDAAALRGAIAAGGRVVGVIGTPLDQATPRSSADLQQQMAAEHLVLTQFPAGSKVRRRNFPIRNRTMAQVTDGTAVVEATDQSGVLYQADACRDLGRWLFVLRRVVEDPATTWPADYLGDDRAVVVDDIEEILRCLE